VKRWEHSVKLIDTHELEGDGAALFEAGQQGWELVAVVPVPQTTIKHGEEYRYTARVLYFKRELVEPRAWRVAVLWLMGDGSRRCDRVEVRAATQSEAEVLALKQSGSNAHSRQEHVTEFQLESVMPL
jgi:hypothetical protein